MKTATQTREQYIHAIRDIGLARLTDQTAIDRIQHCKLVYGIGKASLRGRTCYNGWKNGKVGAVAELSIYGEESLTQLAGTTLHELGHVIAVGAGHGADWHAACEALGLRRVKAAGTRYLLANFAPDVRLALVALAKPSDGIPLMHRGGSAGFPPISGAARGCAAGLGVRGGTSRGPGSGSRLIKIECACCGYVARTTRKWLDMSGAPLCPTAQCDNRGKPMETEEQQASLGV